MIAFAVVALLGANPVWVVLGAGLFGFFFLDVGKISKKPRTPASDKDEKTEEGGAST